MKTYITIPRDIQPKLDIIAFGKLDGSNIRAEWTPKRGFHKFGSRKVLIDDKHELLGKAIELFKEKYADGLAKVYKKQRWSDKVTCFFEYHGPLSFAGNHHEDDDHDVTLFDVSPHKQAMIAPRLFVKMFEELGIPKVLYQGRANQTFVDAVKNSEIEGMPLEGVVCKAPNPNGKKTSQPVMFKVKSDKWLQMLKEFVNYDEALFKQLM